MDRDSPTCIKNSAWNARLSSPPGINQLGLTFANSTTMPLKGPEFGCNRLGAVSRGRCENISTLSSGRIVNTIPHAKKSVAGLCNRGHVHSPARPRGLLSSQQGSVEFPEGVASLAIGKRLGLSTHQACEDYKNMLLKLRGLNG